MITGTFDVVGAAEALRVFGSLDAAHVGHGYVFSGADGVGKYTFALRLAQSLLCETPKTTLLGYCNRCNGCALVNSGTHPDLLTARGQLKIGDRDSTAGFHENEEMTARDLVRQFSLHAYLGGWRIFVLQDVEFTREAANALLKFFEEPPARVLMLLTTSAPGRLLATVRSRLVDVRFGPLSESQIADVLQRAGFDLADAQRAAAIAQGSVDRALSLTQGEAAAVRDSAVAWFFAVVRGEDVDDSGWAARATLEEGLQIVKTLTRDWLVTTFAQRTALAADQTSALAELPVPPPQRLAEILASLTDAERLAQTNVPPHLVAEMARMALSTARSKVREARR